jgi:hypothetical protein
MMVEAGVRFVTIQGYVDTGIYAWDHHWGIFPHLEQQLPFYDNSYSALLNDLDDRGLLEFCRHSVSRLGIGSPSRIHRPGPADDDAPGRIGRR